MKKMISTVLLVAGLASAPSAVFGQAHHQEGSGTDGASHECMMSMQSMHQAPSMMGQGGMMGMAMGPGPEMILAREEALGLDASQVEGLKKLQQQMAEQRQARMEPMARLREQLEQIVAGEAPDIAQYESIVRQMADLHVDMRVQSARFGLQALGVLTDDQRAEVRNGAMPMMKSGGLMRSGMEDMEEMACPMMGGMGEAG